MTDFFLFTDCLYQKITDAGVTGIKRENEMRQILRGEKVALREGPCAESTGNRSQAQVEALHARQVG